MKKGKTIGCEEALSRLFAYLDQRLGASRRREIEHHLEICRTCFSKAEFEKRLKAHFRTVGRNPLRASFEHRMKTLLNRL